LLSVIGTIAFSILDLIAGVWLLMAVEQMPRRWGPKWSAAPAYARWMWAGLLVCGAGTALMMALIATIILIGRGVDSAVEAGLCARMGTYTALATLMVRRWSERWTPRPGSSRGPRLLGPGAGPER
jgi:hypothetical protein